MIRHGDHAVMPKRQSRSPIRGDIVELHDGRRALVVARHGEHVTVETRQGTGRREVTVLVTAVTVRTGEPVKDSPTTIGGNEMSDVEGSPEDRIAYLSTVWDEYGDNMDADLVAELAGLVAARDGVEGSPETDPVALAPRDLRCDECGFRAAMGEGHTPGQWCPSCGEGGALRLDT